MNEFVARRCGRRLPRAVRRGRAVAPALEPAGRGDPQVRARRRRAGRSLLPVAVRLAVDGARARRGVRGAAGRHAPPRLALERARCRAALPWRPLLRSPCSCCSSMARDRPVFTPCAVHPRRRRRARGALGRAYGRSTYRSGGARRAGGVGRLLPDDLLGVTSAAAADLARSRSERAHRAPDRPARHLVRGHSLRWSDNLIVPLATWYLLLKMSPARRARSAPASPPRSSS